MMQWMKASEVARELAVSTSYAYKLIHQLNNELNQKGYLIEVSKLVFQHNSLHSQSAGTST